MPSTIETGHAKNVATFEDLISYCTGYGANYNPTKAILKLTAMNPQLAAAQATLQTVKTSKTTYDNATNAREIALAPLKPLATKIINALAATDATPQTVNDARTVVNKIQGRRAKKVVLPTAKAIAEGAEPVRISSTAQQSYDKLVDHFAQLIAVLAAEPKYLPNENELKVATLNTLLADMKTKNTAVVNAWTAVSNSRINRNKVMYGVGTGMVDVALAAKTYVKSVFGPKSSQFKQVSGLKFTKYRGD